MYLNLGVHIHCHPLHPYVTQENSFLTFCVANDEELGTGLVAKLSHTSSNDIHLYICDFPQLMPQLYGLLLLTKTPATQY